MKKYLLVIFVIVSTLFSHVNAQRKPQIDVYLIGGQSNATGQGYLKNLPPEDVIEKNVLIFHSGKPHLNGGDEPYNWHPLQQASESPDRFGLELGFGKRIQELYPKQKIALIKHAHSGTNLYKQWNPGKNNLDTLSWGDQYKTFVKTVQLGLADLEKQGYKPVIKGMLWQQGESDADSVATAKKYAANLSWFIKRVKNQFKSPKMKFIYGYVMPPPNTSPGRELVRQAEKELDQNSGSAIAVKRAFVVATDDLSQRANDKDTRYPKDYLHFGTAGTWLLGVRMADAMFYKH